jgi:hypothetical protein
MIAENHTSFKSESGRECPVCLGPANIHPRTKMYTYARKDTLQRHLRRTSCGKPFQVVFGPLKRAHGKLVEGMMVAGNNHIDKEDFLHLYPPALEEVFNQKNIPSWLYRRWS